jgi:hypothetical protein
MLGYNTLCSIFRQKVHEVGIHLCPGKLQGKKQGDERNNTYYHPGMLEKLFQYMLLLATLPHAAHLDFKENIQY